MSTKKYFLLVLIVVVGILASFYAGFLLRKIGFENNLTILNNNKTKFNPTFVDEIVVISKDYPHRTIILSAFRTASGNNTYSYLIKSFYYNGEKWTRDITELTSPELYKIPSTSTLLKWEIVDDPSYMLRLKTSGEINIDDNRIIFNAQNLNSEMGIRSSHKYTKFMSEGNTVMEIDGKKFESYVLYSRVYSFDPPENLVYTSDPAGINTEWLAFWDNEGNFYSIDETIIDNKITFESYKAHSLAVLKDNSQKISKSFSLNLEKNKKIGYKVNILENINKQISINYLNSVSKAKYEGNIWLNGLVTGSVTDENGKIINGFGVYEQINQ